MKGIISFTVSIIILTSFLTVITLPIQRRAEKLRMFPNAELVSAY